MAYVKGQPFIPQFSDPVTGELMSGGTVEFYLDGTTTPTPYYTDLNGTAGGTTLTLNAGGRPDNDLYFDTEITYKIIIKNASGAVLDTITGFNVQDMAEAVASINVLNSSMDTAEQNISTLQDDVDTAETNIANAQNSITAIDVRSASTQTDLDALESQVTAGLSGGAPVYADTTAGLAATSDTEYFSIPSGESDESLILYLNNAGVAEEKTRLVNNVAVDNAITAANGIDQSALSPYDLVQQNYFDVNTTGAGNFNGGTFVHDVGNQRITVTTTNSGQGIEFGPELTEGKDYLVMVDYTPGTASDARLVSRWANDAINPLVEGWNQAEFTADSGGAFGNDITVASLGAGDFYINSIHIFEITSRSNAFTTTSSNSQSVEFDIYSDDYATNNLVGLTDWGYSGSYTVNGGQLEVQPTTDGQIFILNASETTNEGDWFECVVDLEIVDDEPVEFYPYWANQGGTVVTLSTSGKHTFLLKGDGTRTATAELQHVLFRCTNPAGATLRFNSIKVRRVGVNDITFSNDIEIGEPNTITSPGASYGDYLMVGTNNTLIDNAGSIVIGTENTLDNVPLFGGGFIEPSIVIGNEAEAHCGRNVSIGYQAYVGSVSGTTVGALAAAYQPHDVAVGRGAHTQKTGTEPNQVCLGSLNNHDLYVGSGISSRFLEPGTLTETTVDPTTVTITIHGYNGYDDIDGTVANIAGGPLRLAGGRSTGTATGGSVYLSTSPASVSENNTKNTLINQVEIDTNQTTGETGMLLLANGSLRRVKLGAADSGGAGLTALVIDNV